ncbi:MAG: hypothetical protein QGH74_08520 [Candidatus Brocadiia bacterium]|jgi:hypothetical protein|nr:hypothetical protein [Candidatus Brocadiia bacterium]
MKGLRVVAGTGTAPVVDSRETGVASVTARIAGHVVPVKIAAIDLPAMTGMAPRLPGRRAVRHRPVSIARRRTGGSMPLAVTVIGARPNRSYRLTSASYQTGRAYRLWRAVFTIAGWRIP